MDFVVADLVPGCYWVDFAVAGLVVDALFVFSAYDTLSRVVLHGKGFHLDLSELAFRSAARGCGHEQNRGLQTNADKESDPHQRLEIHLFKF